jgi:uncharacterized protein (TIGR02466 family)
MPLQCRDLFSVRIFRNTFPQHEVHKPIMMDLLKDRTLYVRNTLAGTLHFTHPNLHKIDEFKPVVDFIKTNVAETFTQLGFIPKFQMTGMWATRHPRGGFHHRHSHGNSFLAGIYYLDGAENASNTEFYSPHQYNNIIVPPRLADTSESRHINRMVEVNRFEEGTLIIFPAWLVHDTAINYEQTDRTVLSFNIMPVGKTNHDTFDRFNYAEIQTEDMISYADERFST